MSSVCDKCKIYEEKCKIYEKECKIYKNHIDFCSELNNKIEQDIEEYWKNEMKTLWKTSCKIVEVHQSEIDDLQSEIDYLQSKIDDLRSEIDDLKEKQ